MKKTTKNKTESSLRIANPKGQKLPYAKLRALAIETIQQSKSPSWTPRQLIKKLKIANGRGRHGPRDGCTRQARKTGYGR
ncbi:MAG: hypothetical protein IPP25_20325 [Saprospiraceae bacterium]|nr:hypothetical protein [Candidatus Opimibacter skivensis]